MVYLMVHFIVVVVDIEVFFAIDYPVLGTKIFSGTNFLILRIMVFFGIGLIDLSFEPFLDIIRFTLLKHIVASFDITIKQVLNSKVSFNILNLLIDQSLTIDFNNQVFFIIIATIDYFDFTISLLGFGSTRLHLGLAKQRQMALLEQLILCFTDTSLSYQVLDSVAILVALAVQLAHPLQFAKKNSTEHEHNPTHPFQLPFHYSGRSHIDFHQS